MRRRTVAMLLTVLVMIGTLGSTAPARAEKVIAFGSFYRRLAPTKHIVFICEASALGGLFPLYTQITSCTMSGSFGGFARGVTPVIYPGLEAITVGTGPFEYGVYTMCITAKARWGDGTILTRSGCETASPLPPS